jgi:hypothetical protein
MSENDFLTFEDLLNDQTREDYQYRFFKELTTYSKHSLFKYKQVLGVTRKHNEHKCYINTEIKFKPFVKIEGIIYKVIPDKFEGRPIFYLEPL